MINSKNKCTLLTFWILLVCNSILLTDSTIFVNLLIFSVSSAGAGEWEEEEEKIVWNSLSIAISSIDKNEINFLSLFFFSRSPNPYHNHSDIADFFFRECEQQSRRNNMLRALRFVRIYDYMLWRNCDHNIPGRKREKSKRKTNGIVWKYRKSQSQHCAYGKHYLCSHESI